MQKQCVGSPAKCLFLCYLVQGINRTLLSWLKLWDECVFGRSSLPVGVMKGGQGKKGEEKGQMKGVKGKNFEKKVEYKDPSAFAVPEVCVCVPGNKASSQALKTLT